MAESDPYRVRWLTSEAQVDDAVWEAAFPPPFEGRWWYRSLERAGLEDQFSFHYALILDGDRPIGLAPAFTMDVPMRLVVPPGLLPLVEAVGKFIPSALHQRTLFIGSPCSEEGRVGLLPGGDAARACLALDGAMKALARKLKAPMRVWKDFPDSDRAVLEPLARSQGLFPVVSFPSTVIRFTGPGFEDYLSGLKSSRRNKLSRKLRSARAAPLVEAVIRQPDSRTLQEIFALFWRTYQKGDTKFERLTPAFFAEVSRAEASHFILLREQSSGDLVAFVLCFALGDRVINKFIGIDYERPKDWFLYFRLWESVVRWSQSIGATEVQSGQTAYAPKIEIGNRLQPLTNYCAHANPLVHRVYRLVARTVNWDSLDKDLAIYLAAHPGEKPRS